MVPTQLRGSTEVQSSTKVPSKLLKLQGLKTSKYRPNSSFLLALYSSKLKNSIDKEILKILSEEGAKSRPNLVKRTGIPRTTVFDALSRLNVLGLIEELSLYERGKKGRPTKVFQIASGLLESFSMYSSSIEDSFKNLALILGVFTNQGIQILSYSDLDFISNSFNVAQLLNRQIPALEAVFGKENISGLYGPFPVIGHSDLFTSVFSKPEVRKLNGKTILLIFLFDRKIESQFPARKQLEAILSEVIEYLPDEKDIDPLYLTSLKAQIARRSLES